MEVPQAAAGPADPAAGQVDQAEQVVQLDLADPVDRRLGLDRHAEVLIVHLVGRALLALWVRKRISYRRKCASAIA